MTIEQAANQFIKVLTEELPKLRCVAVISEEEVIEYASYYVYCGALPRAIHGRKCISFIASGMIPVVNRAATQYGLYSEQFLHTVRCVLCIPILSNKQLKDARHKADWSTPSDWPSQARVLRALEKSYDELYRYNPCGIRPRG